MSFIFSLIVVVILNKDIKSTRTSPLAAAAATTNTPPLSILSIMQ